MKEEKIWIKTIKTNNLKGFDLEIYKNKINCIIGPSGSGKSSLAFDTVYAISDHEYKLMIGDDEIYQYDVEDYSNLLVSVALKQSNYNLNKRSTISTYYGLDTLFKYLFSSYNNISSEMFSFNKFTSACKMCKGLGYVQIPDISTMVDYDLALKEIPFIPWMNSSARDYFKQILQNVAKDYGISLNIPFRDLDKSQHEFLINGISNKKYKINFSQGGRKRVKTDYFYGINIYVQNEIGKSNSDIIQYTRESVCPLCHGSRFNNNIDRYKILEKTIGDLYLMEFTELRDWLLNLKTKMKAAINIDSIIQFTENAIEMRLGYLFLNRSIPSLSGGEFQRLRLSQILKSKFENLLIIIDEPLASLHVLEKDDVIEKLEKMKKKNTLLLVEHDTKIIPICDKLIALGPSGGVRGGNLISSEKYLSKETSNFEIKHKFTKREIEIISTENINNVKPFKIKLSLNSCIGICGISGSGKTTFVREILPKYIPNYKYISQKPIRGNSYSQVVTYLNIVEKIRELFSKTNKIEASFFQIIQLQKELVIHVMEQEKLLLRSITKNMHIFVLIVMVRDI